MTCYLCQSTAKNIVECGSHSYIICDKCKPGCMDKIKAKQEEDKNGMDI